MDRQADSYPSHRHKSPQGRDLCSAMRALADVLRDHRTFISQCALTTATSSDIQDAVHADAALCLLVEMGLVTLHSSKRIPPTAHRSASKSAEEAQLTDTGRKLIGAVKDVSNIIDQMAPTREWRPSWDSQRRELRVGGEVVKRFRRSADNQELLLAAFEESHWEHEIDDPLPQRPGARPADRLRETTKRLNRSIKDHLLQFGVSHQGTSATWRLHDFRHSSAP